MANEEPWHAPLDRGIDRGCDVAVRECDSDTAEVHLAGRMMHLNAETLRIRGQFGGIIVVAKHDVGVQSRELIEATLRFKVAAVDDVDRARAQQRLHRALRALRLSVAVGEDPEYRR